MSETRPILPALTQGQRDELLARLEQSVDRSGGPLSCWPWTGGSRVRGYGVLWTRQGDGRRRMVKAHRLVFEVATGESPPTVDHRCHDHTECDGGESCPHRLCCNPEHLAPESVAGNASRARSMRYQETCERGHDMRGDNLYEHASGRRQCRACAADKARENRAAARMERPSLPPKRSYRPRGMTREQLVEWGLDGNSGDGCWEWRDGRIADGGYVDVHIDGKLVPAHRLVYEGLVGPIPDRHVIDHTCHDPDVCPGGLLCPHRACVNPTHLKAIPGGDNASAARAVQHRPTHCLNGHEFTPENTWTDKRGSRYCRECGRERNRRRHELARESNPVDARYRVDGRCRNGHDVAVAGLTSGGRCAQCSRESSARSKARRRAASV